MEEKVSWMATGSQSLGRSITQSKARGSQEKSSTVKKASSKMDTKMREMDKRLRTIYEDNGMEYGADSINQDDICSRFGVAVSLRRKSVSQLFRTLRLAQNVDLCFLVDATSNMQPHINGVKDSIYKIVEQLSSVQMGQEVKKLRLAMVAYRDHCDSNQFEILSFTDSTTDFRAFCSKLMASGGGDTPEDVFGGLEKAIQLNWDHKQSGTKLVFHICDAPCHGRQFHNLGDSYPNGDPKGRKHTDLFAQLLRSKIQYYFGRINIHTDLMIKKFEQVYEGPIETFDIKKVENICGSVVTAVRDSMLTTNTVMMVGSSKAKTRRFVMEEKEPDWNTLKAQEGHSITYKYPESIKDIVADVPLDRPKTKFAHVKIAPKPFAKGAERVAFYGQDVRSNPPLAIVLKEYIQDHRGNVAKRFENSNQMQTVAAYLADGFCAAIKKKSNETVLIKFLKPKTVAIGKGLTTRYLAYERRFFNYDQFVRFTNNTDYKIPTEKVEALKIPEKFVDLVMTFSHWSYKVTEGNIMVVDLQGILNRSDDEISLLLTDPAIHCLDPTRFGPMNLGKDGMKAFLKTHKCNKYCKVLKL